MKKEIYEKIVECLKTYSVCVNMDFEEECYTVGNGKKKYNFGKAVSICRRTRSGVYYVKKGTRIGLVEFDGQTWFY